MSGVKLPDEFAGEYDLRGMGHVQRLIETTVRDCAKVAYEFDWNRHTNPRGDLFRLILARYGLKEE